MEIQIETPNVENQDKLEEYIEKKVNKLEKFFDNIIDAHVYLKNEQDKGNLKQRNVELKLNIPATTLFAEEKSDSFEKSVDMAVKSIERQLKKHKEKSRDH
ncbi:MAG: ribosome-associated translation inhibitor RaiA [Bacteroidetes bacterium SW_11_45_7]|jgi:putative sigma-54 modulation protein|nr:MAG: ribosome-associated translation inhibitor RaiA [Bacteroidetes bacterium SW_11_45_7]